MTGFFFHAKVREK